MPLARWRPDNQQCDELPRHARMLDSDVCCCVCALVLYLAVHVTVSNIKHVCVWWCAALCICAMQDVSRRLGLPCE